MYSAPPALLGSSDSGSDDDDSFSSSDDDDDDDGDGAGGPVPAPAPARFRPAKQHAGAFSRRAPPASASAAPDGAADVAADEAAPDAEAAKSLDELSVRELKARLKRGGVDYSDCVEKGELVRAPQPLCVTYW